MPKGKKGRSKAKVKAGAAAAAPVVTVAKTNNSQELAAKDQVIFRQVIDLYENKQYKPAIESCDRILAQYPVHGETLAMKGLAENGLGNKEEAHALIKKGVSMNIKSHMCWHVYGLLYRSEHKYDDAIKCYSKAIARDPENMQILRDLANLQVQRRMAKEFTETRRKILNLKPGNRANWMAFAVGNHLKGDFKTALSALDKYDANNKNKKGYEYSELLLYKNMLLEESGDLEKAIAHLNEIQSTVMDELYVLERRGHMCLKLGQKKAAEKDFRTLVDINPENHSYHWALVASLGISDSPEKPASFTADQSAKLTELFETYKTKYPNVTALQRLPLEFSNGADFEAKLGDYLTSRLRKGIPSLFRDLRSMYDDQEKATVMIRLLDSYIASLGKDKRFTEGAAVESPAALAWCYFFRAQHFDHVGDSERALRDANLCIDHTPTNIDAYVLKARVLKHAGQLQLAWTFLDQARRMDTADRYLNTKCTRYALRAGKVGVAEETVALFLRENDNLNSLFDMQCSWYENECGQTHLDQKQHGKALKQFTNVIKHFHDMEEDQIDFHSYCLRKVTLRAYVKMMRMQDNLRSHRFFVRAARGCIRTYLAVEQQPAKGEEANEAEKEETKKEEDKEAGESKEEEEKKEEEDKDPNGEELLKLDPLTEAAKFAKDLLVYSNDSVESHLLAGEVYARSKNYLLWLKSLTKCVKLSPSDPAVRAQIIQFIVSVEKDDKAPKAVVNLTKPKLGLTKPHRELVEEWADASSLLSVYHTARSLEVLGDNAPCSALVKFDVSKADNCSYRDCAKALDFLAVRVSKEEVETFKACCASRFPACALFKDEEEQAKFSEHETFKDPLTNYIVDPTVALN